MRAWLLLLFLLLPFAARADEPHQEAYLHCDPGHNRFVVRFGLRYNDDPAESAALAATALPVAQQLQEQHPADDGACTLADGTQVALTFLAGQAYAYGQGGGDPNVTFTLAFNDVPLYFQKTFYTGYASAFPARYDVSALAYDGHTLLACPGTMEEFAPGPIAPPAPCQDDSGRLQLLSTPFVQGFAIFSDAEKTRLIDDLRRRQLTARLSPFCQELDTVEESYVAFTREDGSSLESADIDINNDGELDHVVRVADDTGYFDGSFLVVYPAGKPREPDETTLAAIDPERVREEFASHRWPAILISLNNNVSPRYSRNEVLAYDGKNYILSSTTNRSMIPARLVSVLPAAWSFAKTLCEYP